MKTFPGHLNIVHLSSAAMDDLRFWEAALPTLPARLLLLQRPTPNQILNPQRCITSDASNWGVGAYYTSTSGETFYFSIPWNPSMPPPHSTWGELFALIVSIALWDHEFEREYITWISDCKPHIAGLFKLRTSAPELLSLHDFIDLRAVRGNYQWLPRWIEGSQNVIADQLSRGFICDEVRQTWTRCHPTIDLLPIAFGDKLSY